jgi:hypothetical protein
MKLLAEGADPNGLLHKVKTVVQLKEIGAEPVDDSCIMGDVAYEVQPGFLAEAAALQAAATAQPAVRAPPKPKAASPEAAAPAGKAVVPPAVKAPARSFGAEPLPKDLEEKRKEAEALARFLLDNLS